jgi:DNA polymerase IV
MIAVSPATVLHVDVDAFFASVEQALNPDYAGKPVIVGGHSTDRSVVASASYEARALGVKTAMPIAAAHRICPNGIFLRGNYHEYVTFSDRVERILRDFSPIVQKVSLDDFYLDLTGTERLFGPPFVLADRAKRRVRRETGLSVSMGIGANRLIAKVASQYAKPNGIAEIRHGYERDFLRPMDVEELPGVGRKTSDALHRFNLYKVGDLARVDRGLLETTFGMPGEALWDHAHGRDDSHVIETGLPKSISRETTFEEDTDDRRLIGAMLHYLAERAARHLRTLRMQARCVSVKLRYSDFETLQRSQTLDRPTDHDDAFHLAACDLLERLYTRRLRVRLIGVCLSSLTSDPLRQTDFLDGAQYAKFTRLYRGLDRVRERYGFSSVTAGASLRLLKETDRDEHGFRLRTSCLTR